MRFTLAATAAVAVAAAKFDSYNLRHATLWQSEPERDSFWFLFWLHGASFLCFFGLKKVTTTRVEQVVYTACPTDQPADYKQGEQKKKKNENLCQGTQHAPG